MTSILRISTTIVILYAVISPGTCTKCDCTCEDLCSSYNTRANCVQYGCAKGYCWASCVAALTQGEWCWTTKGTTWDHQYVKCDHDWDCEPNWHCAGACALFDTVNATIDEMDSTHYSIMTNNV